MKLKKNLVLVGMMGSGKSTIGRLLSKKLHFKFYDIDKLIENNQKMKIKEIFKKKGETYFRNLEEEITINILKIDNSVISLGGGGFLNEKIRKKILVKSIAFWLNWNPYTLINRIKKNNKRPISNLLNNDELENLILKRSKIYSKANHKINCEKLSELNIVKKIIDIYETS